MTGITPAPPTLEYEDGWWITSRDWLALARHQINQQPGSWISSLILASEKYAERLVAHFGNCVAPEVLANEICELYGVLASAMLVTKLADEVLERRLYKILDHVGIEKTQQENWVRVFGYPERKTESMREREVFFVLAGLVKRHAMDRPMRLRVSNFAERYGYLGLMTPAKRRLTFSDTLHRVSQLSEPPNEIGKREAQTRESVLNRASEFMNRVGLDARERDAIKAYRDVAYWKLRQRELVALMEVAMEPAKKRLAGALKISTEYVLAMRVEEMSRALIKPMGVLVEKELAARFKKSPKAFFVEDIVEIKWL